MAVFGPEFLEEIRARVSIAGAIGAKTKLVRSGRHWKACCPFHGEKTPSFYVYDDHYHCFGCGLHGDVIAFAMEIGNLSFTDAVEKLAGEAGLKLPRTEADGRAMRQRERARKTARHALACALDFYRRDLLAPHAEPARAYLRRRGITPETAEKFGLGWAGRGNGLQTAMQQASIGPQVAFEAGLMRANDGATPAEDGALKDWGAGRPFFYDRLMIPIFDGRGEISSFGGRTLGDGQPKYINGPETPCFHKKTTLYNFSRARQSDKAREKLLVVEGYLDVIALDQCGIDSAVAPLGTAIGEEQLKILWRVNGSPIFCLDGDKAGRSAALRVCERALSVLKIGSSLRVCFLPDGEDPDSLVRGRGVAAFEECLGGALSLADALFMLWEEAIVQNAGNPDQRAAFRGKLVQMSEGIADATLKSEYKSGWLDKYFEKYRASKGAPFRKAGQADRNAKGKDWRDKGKPDYSALRPKGELRGAQKRMEAIIGVLLHMPGISADIEDALWNIDLPEDLAGLREAVCDAVVQEGGWTFAGLRDDLAARGLWERAQELRAAGRELCETDPEGTGNAGDRFDALKKWWHLYGFMDMSAFSKAVQEAEMPYILGEVEGEYPLELKARREALFALRRGEAYQPGQ